MFQEFDQQDNQQPPIAKPSTGKTTPRPEFPELKCSIHRCPVILVSTKQDCQGRIFLCSRCVTTELEDINKYNPLIVYDDFVRFIHEPSGLKTTDEAQKIVKQKSTNVSGFFNHIKQEQYLVSQIVNQLNDRYKHKCSELATSLQEQLESEKDIFQQNYEKFEREVNCDKEKEAEMPKFHEIKAQIGKMTDLEEIENYMKNILRNKQQWKDASIELRTLGKRSEDYYRELIESHQTDKPSFAQGESIIEYWNTGLDKLIEEVKRRANCFQNLFSRPDGIHLHISQINELGLLTNQMIKEDTELRISFGGQKFTNEVAEKAAKHISILKSLKHLFLDFSSTSFTEESLTIFFDSVKTLTGIENFSFSCEGSRNKNVAAIALAKILPNLVNVKSLKLNFAFSDLHCQGAVALAEATAQLTQITSLYVQFQANIVKEEGAKAWGNTLESLKQLENLYLSFGGYSNQKNKIKDEGATYLVKPLRCLTNLTSLVLNFGYTGIHNSFTLEFALSVKELNNLKSIDLQFHNNGLGEKGGKKIAKALSKMVNLETATLNLNNNELKKEGVREIIDALRRNNSIQNLTIYLRNVGLQKDDGKNLQSDLTHGRSYEKLELFV